MTEVSTDDEPEPPERPRLRLLAGAAGAVVVLAALGATGGWLLAGVDGDRQGSAGRSQPPATSSPPPPSPTNSEPSPTESADPGAAEFLLPDVTNLDFVDARRQLRQRRLGVQVDFDDEGDGRTVERTTPRAGATVHAGITVKLHVRGEPPTLQVPSLLGMTCAEAGRDAADRGLIPHYRPRKQGLVVEQDPEPYEVAQWNDRIKLDCEDEAPTAYGG